MTFNLICWCSKLTQINLSDCQTSFLNGKIILKKSPYYVICEDANNNPDECNTRLNQAMVVFEKRNLPILPWQPDSTQNIKSSFIRVSCVWCENKYWFVFYKWRKREVINIDFVNMSVTDYIMNWNYRDHFVIVALSTILEKWI